jgi:ATP-dependent Lhr-like helicase
VERLRSLPAPDGGFLVLAATDPANPYGVTIPWPPAAGRTSRAAGAYVLLDAGELRLYLERGGRHLLTFGDVSVEALAALAACAGRTGKVEVRTVNGEAVAGSALAPMMRQVGFGVSPRGLVLWPDRHATASA